MYGTFSPSPISSSMILVLSRTLQLLCLIAVVLVATGSLGAANYTNTVTGGGYITVGDNAILTNPATAITGGITDNGSLQFLQSGTLIDTNLISGTGYITQGGAERPY
jgi:hypothetical protein